ncbi:MAG: alpha/beta fold hydrolase [Gammaproteobacteria bacterium]|nr:alpha/beta fold hydrolase [Gammaproteobacteria bacterium]
MKLPLLSHLKRYGMKILHASLFASLGAVLSAVIVFIYLMDSRPDLYLWHTVELGEEYNVKKQDEILSFDDYLRLEDKLFEQLQTEIYSTPSTIPKSQLNRFDKYSLADPTHYQKNWNRSFIMAPEQPRGGILLLHGLSDSPYSLRALAIELYQQGYYVLGLRMPGHGTVPSGLVHTDWQDMAAAVKLAANHVSEKVGPQQPLYLLGYSMGAAQAVNYSLDALLDKNLRRADAMVLISPAIGVSAIAALAVWQSRLSAMPGMEKLAWNSIGPEYDPYKYTSFAVNAGDLMYRLTLEIDRKMTALNVSSGTEEFHRTLALMSLVDATVSTHAVVTHLFDKLENIGNELVIFDINRHEVFTIFLKDDPIVEYRALLKRSQLNFDLTFFTNTATDSDSVLVHRWFRVDGSHVIEQTDLLWPDHVYSLAHVALPFSPEDSLYGSEPEKSEGLHIGLLETKGERGVLNIHASDMLRLRYNPFYSNMQKQITDFLAAKPVY